jgi:hypothetical protein
MSSTRQKVLYLKVLPILTVFAIVALWLAYCPVDAGKKPHDGAEESTFSLIPPSFVKNSPNQDILW